MQALLYVLLTKKAKPAELLVQSARYASGAEDTSCNMLDEQGDGQQQQQQHDKVVQEMLKV